MKRTIFLFLLFAPAFALFAQRLSTVGVPPFEAGGGSVGTGEAAGSADAAAAAVADAEDAGEAARLVREELASWGAMSVLPEARAESAEYLVRGRFSRRPGGIALSAETVEARSGRVLNAAAAEAPTLAGIDILSFCAQIAENIPYPNYLLGTWRSDIETIDGHIVCVMEFRSNRSVRVLRFDTWEHSGSDSLNYQAVGSGTYTYAGFRRRILTVGGRQLRVDATASVNLRLEDALPRYRSVSSGGLRILFDDEKSHFEIVSGGIPCGDNYSGERAYPGPKVYHTKFAKIR